jgi:hypothetical protein
MTAPSTSGQIVIFGFGCGGSLNGLIMQEAKHVDNLPKKEASGKERERASEGERERERKRERER